MAQGQFYSCQDLVNETLANLGVLVAGMAANTEDFNYVMEKLPAIFFKLNALEICSVASDPVNTPNANDIRGEWFSDLADIVAGETCTKFGASAENYNKLIMKGLGGVQGIDVGFGAAAKSLRQMNRGRYTGEILQAQYY